MLSARGAADGSVATGRDGAVVAGELTCENARAGWTITRVVCDGAGTAVYDEPPPPNPPTAPIKADAARIAAAAAASCLRMPQRDESKNRSASDLRRFTTHTQFHRCRRRGTSCIRRPGPEHMVRTRWPSPTCMCRTVDPCPRVPPVVALSAESRQQSRESLAQPSAGRSEGPSAMASAAPSESSAGLLGPRSAGPLRRSWVAGLLQQQPTQSWSIHRPGLTPRIACWAAQPAATLGFYLLQRPRLRRAGQRQLERRSLPTMESGRVAVSARSSHLENGAIRILASAHLWPAFLAQSEQPATDSSSRSFDPGGLRPIVGGGAVRIFGSVG